MKDKLGFITSASYGDRSGIPKDYFKEQEDNRIYSKYITFYKTFEIGYWFKATEYLPEIVLCQEVPITELKDLKTTGEVNIFLRAKIQENIVRFAVKHLQPVATIDW
jgi:hypothetical protein